MTIEVRPAGPADARAIAEVHVRGWQETYSHLVSAESLARLSVDQRERRWAELLAASSPQIWVACDDGVVIGTASSSRGHGLDGPRELELEGLYVLASHHGTGAGQQLLDAALDHGPAFLWVATDNPRARAFYARNGFVPDGTSGMHSLAGTPVAATRLVR